MLARRGRGGLSSAGSARARLGLGSRLGSARLGLGRARARPTRFDPRVGGSPLPRPTPARPTPARSTLARNPTNIATNATSPPSSSSPSSSSSASSVFPRLTLPFPAPGAKPLYSAKTTTCTATALVAASPPAAPNATAHAPASAVSNAPYAMSPSSPARFRPRFRSRDSALAPTRSATNARGPRAHHVTASARSSPSIAAQGGAPAIRGRALGPSHRSAACATPAAAYNWATSARNVSSLGGSNGA